MNHDQPEHQQPEFEVMPPTALESITRGEVDLQISTAHRYPRSMALFKKRALDMALIDEETAESCIYCRPVGMKDGQQQYAEGMSIRMAEIVGASYGNIRVGSLIIEQTPRMVKCRGMAHDLESNFASTSECIETTVTKRGDPFSENMRAVVAKACLAKAWRDALFKVVPRALCKPIETEVRKLMVGDAKSLEKRRKLVMDWIGKLGIDVARVFGAIGIQGEEDIGTDQLMLLTGIKNAIKDGDTSIEDAFPPLGANPDGAPKFVPKTKPEPKPKAPEPPEDLPQTEPKAPQDPEAKPQAPATPPAAKEEPKPAPQAEKPAQAAASPTDWRECVIPGKHPKLSGKKLGEFSDEMKEVKEYADGIDMKRATADQKAFVAKVAMAMAELHPSAQPAEFPLAANGGIAPHTKQILDIMTVKKWNPAFFVMQCKINGWLPEEARKIEDITAEDFASLEAEWATVEAEVDKVHQPEQRV